MPPGGIPHAGMMGPNPMNMPHPGHSGPGPGPGPGMPMSMQVNIHCQKCHHFDQYITIDINE